MTKSAVEQHERLGEGPSLPQAVLARGVSKSFPGVQALRDVDLVVHVGEIHGLVGQNGSGKSTLAKIITGAYSAKEGVIEVFGRELSTSDPRASHRAGVGAIYQDLNIIPDRSAMSNVFLGKQKRWGPFMLKRASRTRFRELEKRVGCTIDPDARAGGLSVANQQSLSILRALETERKILIMDEPTAALGPHERERLYSVLGELKKSGVTVIYISHDLDEVLAVCDRISVMRDGELIATKAAAEWRKQALVEAMLGHVVLKPPVTARKIGGEVLRVENLNVPGVLKDVSFNLRRGEILGVAGLVGSGRTELLRALAGADVAGGGRLFIHGQLQPWPRTIRQALRMGFALAPEDRKAEGLVPLMTAAANVTLTDIAAIATGSVISESRRFERAADIARSLDLAPGRLREPASSLSGGNQQKLVVAKWLHRRPQVLLLDEPMRGIDVAAKAEMHSVLSRLANEGMAMIVVSSELEEIIEAADRILVLVKGRAVATLDREEVSLARILKLIFNVKEPHA